MPILEDLKIQVLIGELGIVKTYPYADKEQNQTPEPKEARELQSEQSRKKQL